MRVKNYRGEESLQAWPQVLVRELSTAGFTGLIHATPTVGRPRWLYAAREPHLTAFVAHDEAFATSTFDDVAAWCQAGADWTAQSAGDAYVSAGRMVQVAPDTGIAAYLAQAVRARTLTSVMRAQPTVGEMAHSVYTPNGHGLYQVYDPAIAPRALVDRIRQTLLIAPERARLGFVALLPISGYTWPDRGRALPPLPTVPASTLNLSTPLWGRYLPDAHALQLLTDEHLRHVTDLSRWNVEEVAPGRHLVEATNLDDWFAPEGPPDSVIRQARVDFGNAIIPADADLRPAFR